VYETITRQLHVMLTSGNPMQVLRLATRTTFNPSARDQENYFCLETPPPRPII
jgi:hypothetical protein